MAFTIDLRDCPNEGAHAAEGTITGHGASGHHIDALIFTA
jgi:hypothetical protein